MGVLANSLLFGLVSGISVSIPLGAGGLFCIQRTLSKGRLPGFVAGIGTATSDTIYASLSILCLSFIEDLLETHRYILFLICGFALMVTGITIFASNPVKQIRQNKVTQKIWGDYASAFLISFTNPGCLFFILGVFAFLGHLWDVPSAVSSAWTVLPGVFCGASLWWFSLSGTVNHFRKKFRLRQLWWINRIAGIAIGIFGIIAAEQGLSHIISIFIQ